MKRVSLPRSTPLRRSKAGIARRAKNKQQVREGEEGEAYLAEVRGLPCCVPGTVENAGPCQGGIQACHEDDGGGAGLKCGFKGCIPMCWWHHIVCWTAHLGPFFKWSKAKRREWAMARAEATRALIAGREPRRGVL